MKNLIMLLCVLSTICSFSQKRTSVQKNKKSLAKKIITKKAATTIIQDSTVHYFDEEIRHTVSHKGIDHFKKVGKSIFINNRSIDTIIHNKPAVKVIGNYVCNIFAVEYSGDQGKSLIYIENKSNDTIKYIHFTNTTDSIATLKAKSWDNETFQEVEITSSAFKMSPTGYESTNSKRKKIRLSVKIPPKSIYVSSVSINLPVKKVFEELRIDYSYKDKEILCMDTNYDRIIE